ncbi:MAG: ABC transporter ATP-binding protein [Deltaproteobacteria bacterium RBG_16_48_10]|nr:MAG: ABC transporter ATP-binding protein [Deltaproteobacteria bacterium RBG_16_48_10]
MLKLEGIWTRYGPIDILKGIDLEVNQGELVCLLGGNACGKTTTMKTIIGLVKPCKGKIEFDGQNITRWQPSQIVRAGISPVLEGRRIFPHLTVYENLLMGAYTREDNPDIQKDVHEILTQFPVLVERRNQPGGTLSGGEQQMLAIARAMLARPKMLIMDEPSMGLSPLYVEKTFEIIQGLNRKGITILLVEQNANMALSIAHRGYVLQTGNIVLQDKAMNLLNNPLMREAYLGTLET